MSETVEDVKHECTADMACSADTKESRKQARERERQERQRGKLTDLRFSDIACTRNGRPEFVKEGVLICIKGSRSQFDPRTGKARTLLPPLTGDCCQTFSTLSAVVLSSVGFAVTLSECCSASTLNYLLYISAWMHQLTSSSWPSGGARPTIRDLNLCLHLKEFFPSKVWDDEFDVLFYNQSRKALDLLRLMCSAPKRERGADGKVPVCGYVIVSGDYTVSIFSVTHDIQDKSSSRYTEAWSFYICDSHGTQPWSQGKSSVTGLTFGVPHPSVQDEAVVTVDDGIHYFSTVLFTLLEEHRRGAASLSSQVPYMTWTPLRRRRSLAYTAQELKTIIDTRWIPKVLQQPLVYSEAKKFAFVPLECFWGVLTPTDRIAAGK